MSDAYEYPSDLSDPNDVAEILDWEGAASAWLRSDAAAGWPGGEANLLRLTAKIYALGLQEGADKYAALTIAYQALCEEGTLTEPEEDDHD